MFHCRDGVVAKWCCVVMVLFCDGVVTSYCFAVIALRCCVLFEHIFFFEYFFEAFDYSEPTFKSYKTVCLFAYCWSSKGRIYACLSLSPLVQAPDISVLQLQETSLFLHLYSRSVPLFFAAQCMPQEENTPYTVVHQGR